MSNTEAFDRFYEQTFGNVLGSEDSENREMVKIVWNAVVEHAAQQFDHRLFEELPGNQIADELRNMKAGKEDTHGYDHI